MYIFHQVKKCRNKTIPESENIYDEIDQNRTYETPAAYIPPRPTVYEGLRIVPDKLTIVDGAPTFTGGTFSEDDDSEYMEMSGRQVRISKKKTLRILSQNENFFN